MALPPAASALVLFVSRGEGIPRLAAIFRRVAIALWGMREVACSAWCSKRTAPSPTASASADELPAPLAEVARVDGGCEVPPFRGHGHSCARAKSGWRGARDGPIRAQNPPSPSPPPPRPPSNEASASGSTRRHKPYAWSEVDAAVSHCIPQCCA